MLTKPPIKAMGKIFKASPLLRPRPTSGPATSSLATIAEIEQPIVIEDDEDTKMTGGSAGSADADPKGAPAVPVKRHPALKVPPSTRPKAVLKSAPSMVTRVSPLVNVKKVCCSEGTNCGTYFQRGRLSYDSAQALPSSFYLGT